MCDGRAQLVAGIHFVVSFILCLTSQTGVGFIKTEPFNLSTLLTENEEKILQDLSGFWSYNDTSDISKYEDFDHSKLLDLPGLKFDLVPQAIDDPELNGSPQPHELPVFDQTLMTNISVQLGGSAFLYCKVKNAKDLRVSWVRRRDWHILSSGSMTYTNDERFQVLHTENTDDWDLQIKYVQRRDNGTYECQVATSSGILSHYYNLHVIVPAAFILGSGEYHIGEGSTISLVCVIENRPTPPQYVFWYHNDKMVNYEGAKGGVTSPTPPQYVFWYHNDKMVNYEGAKGGVTVSTEPGPKTHSRLIVNRASHSDSGNYTCRAPDTDPDTIYVFVTKEGENTAAILRQDAVVNTRPHPALLLLVTIIYLRSNWPRHN